MKLFKGLLLGSAAALLAAGGASAADLPSKGKPAAVEYVRVCSTYGAGFFFVPGTQGCLRVSGQVRAEYYYNEPSTRASNTTSTRARARLFVDHRQQTDYGLLRTYMFYQLTKDSGGTLAGAPVLYHGFVQFGGLTAGRVNSFHDFYANKWAWSLIRHSERPINALAYTHSFGGGFSATLALEDGTERRTTINGGTYAGHVVPDIVLALRAEQSWGTAQLSGALHQVRATAVGSDAEYGFAVRAGVEVKMDMVSKGSAFVLEGTYADGAVDYLAAAGDNQLATLTVKNATTGISDATLVGTNLKTTKGWNVMAAYRHQWSPEWRSVLHASYMDLNTPAASTHSDLKELRLAKQLVWSPVSGLDIGAEVLYTKLNLKGAADDSAWSGRLRVQRTF